MAGVNPVENKPETPPAPPAAVALAEPATAPAARSKPWSRLRLAQKFWLVVCGLGLAAAAGYYGYKYFTPDPGRAVAQTNTSEPTPPAPTRADTAPRVPTITDVPDVVVPPVSSPTRKNDSDSDVLGIKPPSDIKPIRAPNPANNLDDSGLPPIKAPIPDSTKSDKDRDPAIVLPRPPVPDKVRGDDPALPPVPPVPGGDKTDPKKTTEPDPFKSTDRLGPSLLPSDMTERKEKATTPVIRIGASDTNPPPVPAKSDDPPPIPKIDLTPPPPAAPMDGTGDKKDQIPALVVPPVKDKNHGDTPPVKAPMPDEPPVIKSPMIPDTPPVKSPAISDMSPVKAPGSDTPPPPPTAKAPDATKKDEYIEDWHTSRDGDTYTSISQEYFHDTKYARALEAYNKDRRKPGDKVIFVPPPYVLQDRFPNLVDEADRPARPEVKTAGNINFEPAPSRPSGSRPAPPPAIGSSDEYKVTAETGETIRDVAKKVYGSADAWRKLWDLNPSIDPTQPIPSGTILRTGR